MLREAWTVGSLEFGAGQVRSGTAILALVSDEELSRLVFDVSKEFRKIEPEALRKVLPAILEDSREIAAEADAMPASACRLAGRRQGGRQDAEPRSVHRESHRERARRERSIRCWAAISRSARWWTSSRGAARTTRSSPEKRASARPPWWKASRSGSWQGDVPPSLRNVTVRTLDLALLQAGAGIKGEFENRLKGLIEEVKSSPTPIILFIDEAHTMIGAGGAAGQNDAANLLKPALARGELRTIAATTWSEYKKYFEKDPALARRFQVVKVEEPTEAKCQVMLRGLVPVLEKHHNVRILDEGLVAAVKFSHRYLADRQLPDKAVSVLDTACARLALGQNATPPAIEDATRQIDDCAVQTRILEREAALGADHAEGLAALAKQKAADGRPPGGVDRRAGRRSATWSARSARSAASWRAGTPAHAGGGQRRSRRRGANRGRSGMPCVRNWPA